MSHIKEINKILSVIVPCYNSSSTVEDTIKSLNLNINRNYIQLILVNDGSTDETLSILKKWESIYPDAILVIDKQNGNWGSVINESKKYAKGKYIRILDSDDQLNTTEMMRFIQNLKTLNDDVVFTNFSFYNVKKEKFIKHSLCTWFNYPQKNLISSFDKIKVKNKFAHITIHAITFRNDIFQKIIDLPEKIFYTDSLLVFEILKLSSTFCYIPHLYLYIYYVGQNEQSVNMANLIKNKEHIDTIFHTIIRLKNPSTNKKHNTWTSAIIRLVIKFKLLSLSFNIDETIVDLRVELLNNLNECHECLSKISYKTTIDLVIRFILITKTSKIFNLVKIGYALFIFDKFITATK